MGKVTYNGFRNLEDSEQSGQFQILTGNNLRRRSPKKLRAFEDLAQFQKLLREARGHPLQRSNRRGPRSLERQSEKRGPPGAPSEETRRRIPRILQATTAERYARGRIASVINGAFCSHSGHA